MYLERRKGYLSNKLAAILMLLTTLSGGIYLVIEWTFTRNLVDTYFVSMLIGASMILILGLRNLGNFLSHKGKDFYHFILSTNDPEKLYNNYNSFFLEVFKNFIINFNCPHFLLLSFL